jgi:hypothetical protein
MKKLLYTLLAVSLIFSACTNHYEDGILLFNKGVSEKSHNILENAILELELINNNQENYENAQKLILRIDSTIQNWDLEAKEKYQIRIDSLILIQEEELKIQEEKIKAELKAELLKYPNLLGKWKCYSSGAYSVLNSDVRIYKKNGKYYQSMVFDKGGSESILELSKVSNNRYNNIGKSDYNIINKDGDLEFWDKQGYFMTCKKR